MKVNSQNNAPASLHLGKMRPVAIKLEAVWVTELVWKIWSSETFLAASGSRTTIPLVTILIALSAFTISLHEPMAQIHVILLFGIINEKM